MLLILSIKKKNGEIELKDVNNNQEKFRTYLGELKKRSQIKEQKNTLYNMEMLYKSRNKAIKFL